MLGVSWRWVALAGWHWLEGGIGCLLRWRIAMKDADEGWAGCMGGVAYG